MRSNRFLIVTLFLLTLVACQSRDELVGKYEAEDLLQRSKLQLVLSADGKGHWNIAQENISFTWTRRGDEVWLHSKTGGVIVGKLEVSDYIDVILPGSGKFRFEKIKE
jgi:hypothetical protein